MQFWSVGGRSILAKGAMVGLLVDGELTALATVSIREDEDLAKQSPSVGLTFLCSDDDLKEILHGVMTKQHNPPRMALVQASTSIFAYRPVLRCLQQLDSIPLADELVLGQPTQRPEYLAGVDIDAELAKFPYDASQANALNHMFGSRVALVQGPPGTGKTFLGVNFVDVVYRCTSEKILCVCYTNHALDSFLEGLHAAGMTSIARVGGRSKSDLMQQYSMYYLSQSDRSAESAASRRRSAVLKQQIRDAQENIERLKKKTTIDHSQWYAVCNFLRGLYPHLHRQLVVPSDRRMNADGFKTLGGDCRARQQESLWKQWLQGTDGGVYRHLLVNIRGQDPDVESLWDMDRTARRALKEEWSKEIYDDQLQQLAEHMQSCDKWQSELQSIRRDSWRHIMQGKRVIGCTTTGAAGYHELLEDIGASVVIVEEAGEILESHTLTALQRHTKHVVMIGDHKQLRPKLGNHKLTVASGEGHNFNRSLFERLVLENFPHATLAVQHRMHPNISALIRPTYPELQDHPSVSQHPPLAGVTDNVIFLQHDQAEDNIDSARNQLTSKTNAYEVPTP
jgi:hypothetical protein